MPSNRVSYGNLGDVERCLRSIELSGWNRFEIFVCENAGAAAFDRIRSFSGRLVYRVRV
jgi:hypothetical protein